MQIASIFDPKYRAASHVTVHYKHVILRDWKCNQEKLHVDLYLEDMSINFKICI